MKKSLVSTTIVTILLVPTAAFAASPSQAPPPQTKSLQASSGLSKWVGPYVGFYTGLNRSSLDGFSTETGAMTGVRGGWNILVRFGDAPIVLGGNIFYNWNKDRTYQSCGSGSGCFSFNAGSTVYGFDARIGYPFGGNRQFLVYIHGGPSHISLTGDAAAPNDNASSRYGLGFVWAPGDSGVRIDIQYTHAEYGAGIGNWTANNLTVGVSVAF